MGKAYFMYSGALNRQLLPKHLHGLYVKFHIKYIEAIIHSQDVLFIIILFINMCSINFLLFSNIVSYCFVHFAIC